MKCFAIENHAMDNRVTMDDSGIVQTLNARMGTGGGNVPLVLMPKEAVFKPVCVMATSHWNAPFTDGDVSPTLCARAGTGGNQLPLVALRRCDD